MLLRLNYLVLPIVALLATGQAHAQVDPFGDPTPPAAAAPAGAPAAGAPSGDPFGAGAPGAPGAAAAADPLAQEPFVIQQFRDLDPTTPPDLLRAARAVLQFGRLDEAKRYLAKFLASKPADEALVPLTTPYGAFLFEIAKHQDLQPEGQQVSEMVLTAAQRVAQDPARIEALIAQLSSDDYDVRIDALNQLAQSGTHIVSPMLRVLADPAREREHRFIRAALARLATTTELPLLGALDTENDYLKKSVIVALGRMGSSRATAHFVRPAVDPAASPELREGARAALTKIIGTVPDCYEAERYLAQETARLMQGEMPYRADADGLIQLWTWDEAKREVVPRPLPKKDAALLLASRTANDLYLLKKGDNAAHRLMLLTNLELAKSVNGLGNPLPMGEGSAGSFAAKAGPRIMSQVLADALEYGRIPAAIAAAEVLGHLGDASVLLTPDGRASPLADAMVHPDRRVRLAAALAAVKLAPGESFPGASRMSDALAWFAGASGSSYVLVGHPRGEDAQTLVGFMNALGYEGQASYIGRALAEEAFVRPDFEFLLVSDAIDLPPVRELVQWLRRDFRTAQLPVGVMARGELLDAARDAFADDPYTTVFPRLHSIDTAAFQVAQLREIAGRNLVSRDERIDQARSALEALAVLAADDRNLGKYNLLRHEPAIIQALYNPALAARAARVLSLFASPDSQTALVDFASQHVRALADRQAAAAAFEVAVKRRGLRLTQVQIAEQYARYNVSETLDVATQELLGALLDTIEAPAIARGELTSVE
jgi:hypothetical protein